VADPGEADVIGSERSTRHRPLAAASANGRSNPWRPARFRRRRIPLADIAFFALYLHRAIRINLLIGFVAAGKVSRPKKGALR